MFPLSWGIEAWRKNEALDSFDVLKKGELITVEGYFKPEEWTDSKSGEKRNRIVMVATKFYPAPGKEEENRISLNRRLSLKRKSKQMIEAAWCRFFAIYPRASLRSRSLLSHPPLHLNDCSHSEFTLSQPLCG